MPTHQIVKEFKIDMAHRLWNQELPDGMPCKCKNVHGHTTVIKIALSNDRLDDKGMIIDFIALKPFIKEFEDMFDHKLVIDESDPLKDKFIDVPGSVFVPYSPTAENFAEYAFGFFSGKLSDYNSENSTNITVDYVEWWETQTAFAKFSMR
ncbi:MAG: 6-carboxytetrahydropterin synthase [Candidatus Peribacteraceae bacterium]|nr:6-carboxytetrahydropterin synthase [Candidatus Peribacteraceae bacterium]